MRISWLGVRRRRDSGFCIQIERPGNRHDPYLSRWRASHKDGRAESSRLLDMPPLRKKKGTAVLQISILHTAEMPNAPYLKAAKSMAEVCGSASVYDYLRRECEKAWDEIKNRDERIADQFIITFNQLLPVQALAFASNRIEVLLALTYRKKFSA